VDSGDVVLFTTTLLAIVNPLSSVVLFATMSGRFGGVIQRRMANQSAFAVLVILLVCVWIGRPLLQVLGISVPMLQGAGGLILLLYGIRMVTVEELKLTAAEQESAEEMRYNIEVRAMVRELLRRETSVIRPELRPLADRIGVFH